MCSLTTVFSFGHPEVGVLFLMCSLPNVFSYECVLFLLSFPSATLRLVFSS
jgi:hypothetical protein